MSIDHQSQGETARSPSDNKKFFARWTNGRAFARSRTNEQTSFHSYEDERTSRRANYDVFVDRDWQPSSCALALPWALRRPLSKTETERGLRLELRGRRLGQREKLARAEREEKRKEEPLSQLRRKRGKSEQQLRRRSSSFFPRGGRSIKGRRKKERKKEKSGRRGGRKTTGLENNFIISHYSLSLPSQELSELLLCLDQVSVLEFGNRVVVDLGFQRHSLFLYYFWGESLSLSLFRWIVVVSFSFPRWFHFPYPFSMCQGFCFNFSSSVFLFLSCGLHAFVGF